MWTLVLILAIGGGIFSSDKVAMTSISGFSTKEKCEAEAAKFIQENKTSQAGFVAKCIEVK